VNTSPDVLSQHVAPLRPDILRGVYFLACDKVYDLTVAFLNSLRAHNPDISLCLIPFSESYNAIAHLSTAYNFTVLNSSFYIQLLLSYDAASSSLHGTCRGHYRKLMAWHGPYDEFIYVDVDTLILCDFNPLFPLLKRFDFVAATSNKHENLSYVWKRDPSSFLSDQQITFAANTGFFMSYKNAITSSRITIALQKATHIATYLQLRCMEQAFVNYLVVTSGLRFTSLYHLSLVESRHDLPLEIWGALLDPSLKADKIHTSFSHKVLMVHWAGLQSEAPYLTSTAWRYYRFIKSGL